jgi:magnesium chelatase family protein
LSRAQLSRQGCSNATLSGQQLFAMCAIDDRGMDQLTRAINRLGLSARAVHRCLRLARTIADLAGRDEVSRADLGEALGYRQAPDDSL